MERRSECSAFVRVPVGGTVLEGDLAVPRDAVGLVLFAHDWTSGRQSPRNRSIAGRLREAGLATLLVDLLAGGDERDGAGAGDLPDGVSFLADRLAGVVEWCSANAVTRGLRIGLFGTCTGGGVALHAAAREPGKVGAVVSRGGRPDLACDALPAVLCPTLLIVGSNDGVVLDLNRLAVARIGAPVKKVVVVPGAGHLFDESGTLEEAARLSVAWFCRHLGLGGGTYAA